MAYKGFGVNWGGIPQQQQQQQPDLIKSIGDMFSGAMNTKLPTEAIPFVGPSIAAIQKSQAPQAQPSFTPKDVGNQVVPVAQSVLKAAASIEKSIPGSPMNNPVVEAGFKTPLGKDISNIAFGANAPKSWQQTSKEGYQIPFTKTKVTGAGAYPLIAAGAAIDLFPLVGGAEKDALTIATNLAKKASTLEDFIKVLTEAKPKVQTAVNNILKDTKNPINTVEDFFNKAKEGVKPPVGKVTGVNPVDAAVTNITASMPDFPKDKTVQESIDLLTKKSVSEAKSKAEAEAIKLAHELDSKNKGIIPDISPESSAIVNDWMQGPQQGFEMSAKIFKDISLKIAQGKELLSSEVKAAGDMLRKRYSGDKGYLNVFTTRTANEGRKLIPDKLSQDALTLYIQFKDSPGKLITLAQKIAEDPNYKDLLPAFNRMKELIASKDINFQKAYDLATGYFKQRGEEGLRVGYLSEVRPSYITQIIAHGDRAAGIGISSPLKTGTPYSQAREFNDIMDVIDSGNKLKTLNAFDILQQYGERDAAAHAGKTLENTILSTGLGKYEGIGESSIKEPLAEIGNVLKKSTAYLQKNSEQMAVRNFELRVLPEIAKSLKSIVEPDFLMKATGIKVFRVSQAFQKSIELSLSFFHEKQLTIVAGNSMNPVNLIKTINENHSDAIYLGNEKDLVMHTGTVSESGGEQMRMAKAKLSNVKFLDNPLTRAFDSASSKITDFTFSKTQGPYKVHDYALQVSRWVIEHPNATLEQLDAQKYKIATFVNDLYGGLNWEAMGVSRTTQTLLRTFMLAPDWTFSNLIVPIHAAMGEVPKGSASTFYVKSLVSGLALTFMTNLYFNHKPTGDPKNPASYFQVKIPHQDGSYSYANTFFAGDVKDWVTFLNDMGQVGPIGGAFKFLQGKSGPIVPTAEQLLTQKDYYGNPIAVPGKGLVQNTLSELGIASGAFPVPFMASMPSRLYSSSGGSANLLEYVLSSTGMATITEHTPRKDAIAKIQPVYYKMHPDATEAQAYAWASRKVGGKNKKAPNIINDVLTEIKAFEGKTPEGTATTAPTGGGIDWGGTPVDTSGTPTAPSSSGGFGVKW